jgi:hypothetical protein
MFLKKQHPLDASSLSLGFSLEICILRVCDVMQRQMQAAMICY